MNVIVTVQWKFESPKAASIPREGCEVCHCGRWRLVLNNHDAYVELKVNSSGHHYMVVVNDLKYTRNFTKLDEAKQFLIELIPGVRLYNDNRAE